MGILFIFLYVCASDTLPCMTRPNTRIKAYLYHHWIPFDVYLVGIRNLILLQGTSARNMPVESIRPFWKDLRNFLHVLVSSSRQTLVIKSALCHCC